MNKKTLPIFLAFLCMGFGDAVNTFVGPAKDLFELSGFESGLITFAGFIMFGLLSVPMGVFQDRYGKKRTLTIGLSVALLGIILVMIFGLTQYIVFLLAILLLGAGATVLQVAGNPSMRDVSDEGKFSSNLSLGQFFKAIGSFAAPLVFYISYKLGYDSEQSWKVLFPIFAIAIFISIISISALKVHEKPAEEKAASIASCLSLLKNKFVLLSVLGIFIYVGAEVCIASGMPVYFTEQFGIGSGEATKYVMYFFITVIIGRLVGAILLRKVQPRRFLILTAQLSLLGFVLLAAGSLSVTSKIGLESLSSIVTTVALVVITLGFSNIFPLIFSIALDRMPDKSNELSGLMVSAICGGAFFYPVMGWIGDLTGNLLYGFAVPLACMLYILFLGIFTNPQPVDKK